MSEEKQRILLLERVNRHTCVYHIVFESARHYSSGCIDLFNQSLSPFQTLHMKEEENKRLSQRLVSYLLSLWAM